jgi:CHAT domain-containing protein
MPEFSLETVKSALADDEAILYYYWLDKETLLIVVIDRRNDISALQSVTPKQRTDLEKYASFVLRFSPAPSDRTEPAYLDTVQRFTSLLLPQWVKSCLQDKRKLLISPHRLLHALPFHALRCPDDDNYLIQRFAVTYVPNLTSLTLRYPIADQARVLALGIRDYQVAGHTELGPLVDAELEVDELRQLYTERAVAISMRRGADASENLLRQLAQTGELAAFTCLHFATHGINVDSNTPMESCLFLRDSILEGLEIANWRLDAQLVVLSACCSGQRAIEGRGLEELPGDDIFGLQAAFFAAGAKQVLGSLWPVDSAAAREIMVACHRRLAAGEAPEFALQTAVAGYLISSRPGRLRKLYYWAPFFLSAVGRPEKDIR